MGGAAAHPSKNRSQPASLFTDIHYNNNTLGAIPTQNVSHKYNDYITKAISYGERTWLLIQKHHNTLSILEPLITLAHTIEKHIENTIILQNFNPTAKILTHPLIDPKFLIQDLQSYDSYPELHHKQVRYTNTSLSQQLHFTSNTQKYNEKNYYDSIKLDADDINLHTTKQNTIKMNTPVPSTPPINTKQWVNATKLSETIRKQLLIEKKGS